MYKATIYYSIGWDVEQGFLKADTFNELNAKIDNALETLATQTIYFLGKHVKPNIEKVVYNYPSGKTFTKRI